MAARIFICALPLGWGYSRRIEPRKHRREPDTVLRNSALPVICRRSDIARYRSVAYEYVQQLITTQTLKTVGSLPIFGKTYRSRAAHCAREHGLLGDRPNRAT
jgi:hypothetical protein